MVPAASAMLSDEKSKSVKATVVFDSVRVRVAMTAPGFPAVSERISTVMASVVGPVFARSRLTLLSVTPLGTLNDWASS